MTTDNRPDYYRILHVQPDAPTEVIKSSYRTLMQRLKMHPDLGGDHTDAALINEAYGVLSDPYKRATYDRDRVTPQPQAAPAGSAAAAPEAERSGSHRRRPPVSGGPHQCPFCHEGHGKQVTPNSLCTECGSPLLRLKNPRANADWLRALQRMPREMPIRYWLSWPQEKPGLGTVTDVSLSGLGFVTSEGLGRDQFVKLESELLQAIGRVAHCRPADGGWQVGVEFFTLRLARTRGAFVSDQA